PAQREKLLFHYVSLTEKVCDNARRRVLEGQTLANEEKIFSIFEPHTELIKRGKQPVEIQFGHNVLLIEKVCDNARRRGLEGQTLANEEKIFSIFEPHTELIKRGKQPVEIQFGHNVLLIEDAVGFVVDYRVVDDGVLDQDLLVPVMRQLQQRMDGKIKSASFD